VGGAEGFALEAELGGGGEVGEGHGGNVGEWRGVGKTLGLAMTCFVPPADRAGNSLRARIGFMLRRL
jgi:hypothetical protein